MKLISIELNNFRQFYGTQSISFSIEKKRNVTLIHGENNGGKTALLNAIRWCFYAEVTENLLDGTNLINKHASIQGKSVFWVKIRLIHEDTLYEVQRYNQNKLRVFPLDEYGSYLAEHSEPQFLVNTFLPKEMAKFFFYQGEGTGTLNSANNFKHVDDSIKKVMGFTVAETAISHLTTVRRQYKKDLASLDSTGELTSANGTAELLEKRLLRLLTEIGEVEANKYQLEILLSQLEKKKYQLDIEVVKKKYRERDGAASQLKSLKSLERQIIANRSSNLVNWLHDAYKGKLSEHMLCSVNTEQLNVTSRYIVDKRLIQEILESSDCICGHNIESDCHAKRLLNELTKHAVEPELRDRWKLVKKLHNKLASSNSIVLNDINKHLKDLDLNNESQLQQERLVNELTAELKGLDITQVNTIETKLSLNKKLHSDTIVKLDRLVREKKLKEKELVEIERRIDLLNLNAPEAQKIENLLKSTNTVLSLFVDELTKARTGVDDIVLVNMQKLFKQVAFNGYTVKKRNEKWVIVDKSNNSVAAGNGYQAMLAISFVVSLIKFSCDRRNDQRYLLTPGIIAPFIADSILAFIGPDNGRELVRFIASAVEQAVFLFSQAQWSNTHIDNGMRQYIGKEYNLVQYTVLTREEFEGDYPTKLKIEQNEYDVVKFGSDFDRVVIEEVTQ